MRQLGWWALCLVGCLGACADPEGRGLSGEMKADGGDDSGYGEIEPEPTRDAEPMENPDAAVDAGPGEPVEPSGETREPVPDAGQPPRSDAKADTWAVTSKNRLVRFERATGSLQRALAIGGLAGGEQLIGADVRPADGQLYALGASGKLYHVDTESGAASLAATLRADPTDTTSPFAALSGKRFGVDWNPVVDRLRVVSDAGENLRIDAASGNTTTDTAIGGRALVAAAYTQSFAAACRTRLLVIDAGERSLLLQDPPNLGSLSSVGSLGAERFDELTAFEIQTAPDGSDRGLVAAVRGDGAVLLDIDLARGTAERPRSLELEAGERAIGLGIAPPSGQVPQQPGEFTGLNLDERLITFNRGAPGKLCSASSLSGLAPGEKLLGIDVRPADGQLYALGTSGALYRLSVSDARASLVGNLLADAADTSDRFAGLPGAQLGLGWNPVADRLRVLGGGLNLRVNPATAATTTDAALSGVSDLGPLEAAYTNSFAGARSTTL
ncbi:MAG TPA: DUF4394 domain-containing protein, partial [Polyangiales bacterium]|nr:DUF4394 domain-containing protein [Polyangiales bacterium]